jgi:hypothetical protein
MGIGKSGGLRRSDTAADYAGMLSIDILIGKFATVRLALTPSQSRLTDCRADRRSRKCLKTWRRGRDSNPPQSIKQRT